jgi:hypothetical protein
MPIPAKPASASSEENEEGSKFSLESDTMDRLFSPEPFTPKLGNERPVATVKPALEEEEEEEEDDTEEEEEEQSPPAKAGEEEEDFDFDNDEEEQEQQVEPRETIAQRDAKLNGRKVKELEITLTERELELTTTRKEVEELRAKVQNFEVLNANPYQHPDVVKLRDEVLADVRNGVELLPVKNTETVIRNFGVYMESYLLADESKDPGERASAIAKLKATIVDDLAAFDSPYEDLFEDDRRQADSIAAEALRIIQRNVKTTRAIGDTVESITKKSKSGLLEIGVREYKQAEESFNTIFDSISSLSDDIISEDPYSLESIAAKRIKSKDPKAKVAFDEAKKSVLEAFVGPRALTQSEIDALEASGKDIAEFAKQRAKKAEATRKKMAALLVQTLVTKPTLKAAFQKAARVKVDEKSDKEISSVLDAIGSRKAKPKPKTAPYIPASQRPSALDKLFGPEQ